jgi:aryl-alcohol dehydrogenase-like predicted oxidoreductase
MYGGAEAQLGRVLGSRRNSFHLFTKCGDHLPALGLMGRALRKARRSAARFRGDPPPEWQPRTLQWNIEESLRRLRTDRIELIQLHSCSQEILQRGEALQTLQQARREGKVRYIGYSGDAQAALWAVSCGAFDAIQTSINIADQHSLEEIVPRARMLGLGIIAKRPIANIAWDSSERSAQAERSFYWDRLQVLDYRSCGIVESVQCALSFTLRSGAHTAIIGTTGQQHMRANIETALGCGAPDEWFERIRARWLERARPGWVGQT